MSDQQEQNKEPVPEKRETVRKIFVERMKREGRSEEWYRLLKEVMTAEGCRYNVASHKVMALMGYEGPKKEWEIHAAWVAEEQAKLKTPTETLREELREERRVQNFEEAIASLPPNAPLEEVTKWIEAHPAMARKSRSNNPSRDVVITAEDIYPKHGRAPSRSAVMALQHWANHPREFFNSVYTPVKKMTESGSAAGGAAKDVGIDEIERLLKELGDGS